MGLALSQDVAVATRHVVMGHPPADAQRRVLGVELSNGREGGDADDPVPVPGCSLAEGDLSAHAHTELRRGGPTEDDLIGPLDSPSLEDRGCDPGAGIDAEERYGMAMDRGGPEVHPRPRRDPRVVLQDGTRSGDVEVVVAGTEHDGRVPVPPIERWLTHQGVEAGAEGGGRRQSRPCCRPDGGATGAAAGLLTPQGQCRAGHQDDEEQRGARTGDGPVDVESRGHLDLSDRSDRHGR
jgi:hypothetical protein